ncbi:DNA-binding response OmpR family regulator [Paenibacillus shirakamiensis]|uniref:DNA-binding response OmpR family regulator n=1 Tax=Paenibacillus shirakamiensis TaxID=1265935 RepID=A0ABS4JL80_9BACL|nr:response regulator transcription factor [Paenibacillus shirakamiensis]MBP2002443.1 DNA-binding response OmpR family regulator [Paenibacillus shirakamiensis]
MKKVLVVDDQPSITEVLAAYLIKEGFQALQTTSGREAVQLIREQRVDFVILDLMLPDLCGEEVCRAIRRFSSIPILMLTAKAADHQRIQGLSLGADDYVIKPFDPREVMARVRAILRRSGEDELLADRISFYNEELVLDSYSHEVQSQGEIVNLTPYEYKLLLLLVRHPNRPFSREELSIKVLGFDYEGDGRTIDQHVKNLRHKIEPDSKRPKYIITVYGMGYRFQGEAEA